MGRPELPWSPWLLRGSYLLNDPGEGLFGAPHRHVEKIGLIEVDLVVA